MRKHVIIRHLISVYVTSWPVFWQARPVKIHSPLQLTAILNSVHTTPEKFENAALFPRLGLPSTLIRHENGAFQKRSLKRSSKTPALRFSMGRKHFKNGALPKQRRYDNHVISLSAFCSNESKTTGDCCVFKFLFIILKTININPFHSHY